MMSYFMQIVDDESRVQAIRTFLEVWRVRVGDEEQRDIREPRPGCSHVHRQNGD